jgi:proline iminopeptidase
MEPTVRPADRRHSPTGRSSPEPGSVEQRLTQPALLIKGGHDPVTSAEEIDLLQAQVPNGRFQLFVDTAGHFVHAEQPEAYARLITDFILS